MATNLATAYVAVVPSMEGVQGQLMRQLVPAAGRAGDAAGADAGKRMGGRMAASFKTAAVGAVGGMAAYFGGAAIIGQMKEVVREAGNLQQSAGAVNAVFKQGAPQVASWARGAAKSLGLSADEYNSAASLLGSQLKNAGVGMDELGPKTNKLIGLGADLASMFGGTTTDAVEAVSSALKGERDPIEKYGVSLNQAAVDAKAAALGFEKVGNAWSQEASQAATVALIMEQTTDAHGNFAKEANTYQGAVARMSAQWDNLQARLGEMFLPILSRVVAFMSERLLPAVETVMGGVRAFGFAFSAAKDGMIDVTSSGFAGWMERVANTAGTLYAAVSERVTPVLGVVARILAATLVPALAAAGRFIAENRNGFYALGIVLGAGAIAYKAVAVTQAAWLAVTVGVPAAIAAVRSALMTARIAVMLFNSALLANPVALVIAALAALIAGLVLAYNRVGWFKDFVNGAWAGIKTAAAAVANWWTGTLVPALRSGLTAVGNAASWLWNNVMKPVWTGIRVAVAVAVAIVTTIFQGWVWLVRNTVGRAFLWLYDTIIRPVFDRVTNRIGIFRAWWSNVAVPAVRAGIDAVGRFFRWLYDVVVAPVFNRITERIARFRAWWDSTAGAVRGILDRLGRGFRTLFDAYVRPVWDNISRKIADVYNAVRSRVFEPLADWVQNRLGRAFGKGVSAISTAWDKVKRVASAPVDFVVNRVINDGFIANFNKIARKFKIGELPTVSFKGLHAGGIVPGRDPGNRDNLLMPMRSGEGVLTPQAVALLGGKRFVDGANAAARGGNPGHAAVGSAVYGGAGSFSNPLQHSIYASGRLSVRGSAPGWSLDQAIGMLDRATRVKVGRNVGGPTVNVQSGYMPAWWAGYYEGDTVRLNNTIMGGGSSVAKRTVAAHELGHALGLPHSDPSGLRSIMSYANMYQHNSVTGADVAALSRIYGGTGFGSGGGSSPEDDKPGMIQRIVDSLLKAVGFDSLLGRIPGAGFMLDLMKKSADVVFDGFKSWVKTKLNDLSPAKFLGIGDGKGWFGPGPKAPAATVFDGGGWLEQSAAPTLAWHRQRKPDAVLSNDQWQSIHSLARRQGGGGAGLTVENLNAFDMDDALRKLAFEAHTREVLFNV